DLTVLVVASGEQHSLEHAGYAERQRELAAGAPARVRHVATENQRVRDTSATLERGELDGLGRLFRESHRSLRDDYQVSTPRLHHEGARARQALKFRLAIPGEEIEMDRIELRPRLLTPLEEEARAASVGIPSHVEGFELALVHPGGEKRLEKPFVDRIVRPPEGVGPEASERDGSRAREGHVAEVTVGQRVRGRLDAEAVSLRIAHDSA